MNLEQFEKWIKSLEEGYYTLQDIVIGESMKQLPEGVTFVEDSTINYYDSYGNEDTTLKYIFHLDSGQCVAVTGFRSSYNGTNWTGVKEVNKKEIVKVIYE